MMIQLAMPLAGEKLPPMGAFLLRRVFKEPLFLVLEHIQISSSNWLANKR